MHIHVKMSAIRTSVTPEVVTMFINLVTDMLKRWVVHPEESNQYSALEKCHYLQGSK